MFVEGDCGGKLGSRTVAVAQIEQGASLSLSVLEFTSNVEVRMVVQDGHVVHVQSLKNEGKKKAQTPPRLVNIQT